MSCGPAEAGAAETGRLLHVRLGFALDPMGRVTPGCAASSFSVTDPIHLSLQVTGATAGSLVSVSIRDAGTQHIAWREVREVPAGGSYQTFEVGRRIARGTYQVHSTLGGKAAKPQPFVVHEKLRSNL